MKYYLIAGEASGDLHGSNLMKGIKEQDASAQFRFLGGDLMKAHGGEPVKHYRDMAFMGLDVLLHLPTILANMKFCKNDILSWKPDVLILIDYPGFNLRMAKFAHENNIKVFYYIAPKVWAWKEGRVKQLKQYVDNLFVIFPFEIEYFKKFGMEVEYFGNPLNDSVNEFNIYKRIDYHNFIERNELEDKPIIGLVAGSRVGEIKRLLPVMINAVKDKTDYQLVVSGAPSISKELYKKIIGNENVKVVYDQTYQVMSNSVVAIVTSGTATLETALLKTPEVVVFKTSPIAFVIGRALVKIQFFSLVNLILNKMAVKELLQFELEEETRKEVDKILSDTNYKEKMIEDFNTIEKMLGEPGVANRVAKRMITLIKK